MLENTDAALAKILDLVGQAGTPDAINTAGQVAMYSAQGDLLFAHVFLVISAVGFLLFTVAMVRALASGEEGAAGFLVFSGFLSLLSVIIFGFSLASSFSPLNQATAKDPKLAFAYMVMQKFQNQK